MPRDSSGNYTLPASGNPVVTGTTISSTWANATFNDIATALTQSLSRTGQGSMQATLEIEDGTVTAPGLSFGSELTTGLYRESANTVGLTIGGTLRTTWNTTNETTSLGITSTSDYSGGSGQPGFLSSAPLNPMYQWQATGQAANTKLWRQWVGGTTWQFDSVNDAETSVSPILRALRNAGTYTIAAQYYGNTTDYPNHFVYGTLQVQDSAGVNVLTAGANIVLLAPLLLQGQAGSNIEILPLGTGATIQPAFQYFTDNNLYVDAPFTGTPTGGSINLRIGYSGAIHNSLTLTSSGNTFAAPQTAGISLTINGISGTHSTKIADSATNLFNAGFLEVPTNPQAGNYTAVLSDNGKAIINLSLGTAFTYTIPANTSVPYPVGATLTFENLGAGVCTIAITTDTLTWLGTGASGSRTLAQYGKATAHKVNTTQWVISGVNVT